MPRTRSIVWSELKLGVFGLVALALAALMIVAVGGEGGFFWQRYPLRTTFSDAGGLRSGAVVRLSGKDVGKVTAVEFSGAAIDVHFDVSNTVRPLITTASRASIGSVSLLGESIVDVTAAANGTPLRDNDYVASAAAAQKIGDLTETAGRGLSQLADLVGDLRAGRGTAGKLLTDQAVYDQLQGFVGAADRVAHSLEGTKGTAGAIINDPKLYNELTDSLENLRTVTARLSNGEGALGALLKDPATATSVKTTSTNLQGITDRISSGQGTVGKLINERDLYDRLDAMSTHLKDVTEALSSGDGTASKLIHDGALYENMNATLGQLQSLIAAIRKDPKRYLNVRVSIF